MVPFHAVTSQIEAFSADYLRAIGLQPACLVERSQLMPARMRHPSAVGIVNATDVSVRRNTLQYRSEDRCRPVVNAVTESTWEREAKKPNSFEIKANASALNLP